jgi:F-type H+-transporting ATPase subunit b
VQIDWLTLAAQIINFLVLLLLLHHFLYRPIMSVMADREREIAERLEEADAARDKADTAASEAEAKRREIEERRDEMLEDARREAGERRDELLEEARAEVSKKRKRWLESLEGERDRLADDLERRVAKLVGDTLEQALGDLADEGLESSVRRTFLQKIGELDEDRRAELRTAGSSNGREAVLRSAYELEEEERQQLEEAVSDVLGDELDLRFEVAEELVAGFEIAIGDQRVGWSVRDYLRSLDEVVQAKLGEISQGADGEGGEIGRESKEAS